MPLQEKHSKLQQLHSALTHRQWLAVGAGSAILALLSGGLLASRLEEAQVQSVRQKTLKLYDGAERFLLETIRLSFTSKKIIVRDSNVYVAPIGILDKEAVFALLDESMDFSSKLESEVVAIAPERLMDPDWEPVVSTKASR